MTEHVITPSKPTTENSSYLITLDRKNGDYKINFIYLIKQMFKKKWLIISVTGLSTFITILLASTSVAPKYHAKIFLEKPNAPQYQNIYTNLGITHQRIKSQLFISFIKMLEKKSNMASFLESSNITTQMMSQKGKDKRPDNKDALIQQLLRTISIKKFPDNIYELSMGAYTMESSLNIAKDYIAYTNDKLLNQLVKQQQAIANREMTMLRREIDREITQASFARKNEIKRQKDKVSLDIALVNKKIAELKRMEIVQRKLQLEELTNALKIAEQYEIKNDTASSNIIIKDNMTQPSEELPLRGITSLKARIAMLKSTPYTYEFKKKLAILEGRLVNLKNNKNIEALANRSTDDAYIPGIEKKLSKINQLKSLSYNITNIKSYRMADEPAVQIISAIKSNRLSILMGFMLGLLASMSFVIKGSNLVRPNEQNLLT